MKTLKRADVTIHLDAEPEHIPIRGNCIASGNDAYDKRIEDELIDRVDSGDEWAWFCARVSVEFEGIESDPEYLGGCSYKDRDDFVLNSGYYDDMVSTCIGDLNAKLRRVVEVLR